MPKQNRPLVRDGRLQARKKRTDRSYLRPNGATTGLAEESAAEDEVAEEQLIEEAPVPEAAAPEAVAPETAAPEPVAVDETATAPSSSAAPAQMNGTSASTNGTAASRLSGTARALQQQGVRKRREFDVQALAVRDSKYALHELRRIAILATMVVITLIVLSFVLR